ncbi:MAG TPA: hypothetical protein VD903_02895 [Pseudonocardia sp.]|nr:hypothetical protein [Pseudonocardia sp.]
MTDVVDEAAPKFVRAPSTCGDEFENVAWAGTLAVRVRDDVHVGVRFNDGALMEHVAASLGDRVVDLPDAVPYYSVRLGTPGRRKAAPLHHFYVGARPLLGTRDLTRLVRGISQHLSAQVAVPEGHVVNAVPVQTPAGVLLVPQEILAMPGSVDRLLTSAGFAFADVPHATLDLAAGTVHVPEPVVTLSDDVAGLGPSVDEPRLEPGDHPLAGWLLAVGADQVGPLRPAVSVAYAARLIEPPFPDGAQATLDGLFSLVGRIPFTGITWATHDELVGEVRDAGLAPAG